MSGPMASTIAQQAGVTQSIATPKAQPKVSRESEQARHSVHGEEGEEGKDGRPAGQAGAGGPGGAGKAQFGDQDKAKVKRKRVKLKDLQNRETQKRDEARSTEKYRETVKSEAPKPKPKAEQARELGYKKAAGLLMEQSRFTESSVRFEQLRRARDNDSSNALSPKGQQKWMLNNLISMTHICVEQHTGGKAGEAYESRRDCRLIHMAMRGLRDGNKGSTTTASSSTSSSGTSRTGMSKGEYAAKQAKAMSILNHIIEPPTRPDHLPEYSEVA